MPALVALRTNAFDFTFLFFGHAFLCTATLVLHFVFNFMDANDIPEPLDGRPSADVEEAAVLPPSCF